MAQKILLDMGLTQSPHDPCLFFGIPSSTAHPALPSDEPIMVRLYVDDFIYFGLSDEVEHRFQTLLSNEIAVTFMGVVNWFLGTHFTWSQCGSEISVDLCQGAFAQNLVERYRQQDVNFNLHATPYRSGLPIDSIPPATAEEMLTPSFARRCNQYQLMVGSLNWLATNTRPDLTPVTLFLAAYNHNPSVSHVDSALYVIKYLRSTVDYYGIAFHSDSVSHTTGYVHFPFHHDIEAYKDAMPPTAAEHSQLTAYSDACWDSQVGSSVPEGTELDLFKFRSMSGYIILRAGGPIAWSAIHQERTSRSSCEAEVRVTDECIKDVLSVRHRCEDIGLSDNAASTNVYNDNQGCVQWAKTTTTTGMKHLNLRETAICESVHSGEISIHHIEGKRNCADIFTKELKDASHFCKLRDSFMMDRSVFSLIAASE